MNSERPRRIVIPGGSGQVGNTLAKYFHAKGDSVVVLARSPEVAPWKIVAWDGVSIGGWTKELDGADVVINLAGRNVNCRYNPANRREILESRTKSTKIIGEAIGQLRQPPPLWLNASTATIYRHALDRAMDEFTGETGSKESNSPDTWKFSIDVATLWEKSFFDCETPATRKIAMRSAMVMGPERGGIFDTLLRLVRFRLGGASGSGQQFVSWIHDLDFIRAIELLMGKQEITGCVNLASPEPLPNREFMSALRKAWGAGVGLPASNWMLEVGAIFLRSETELILKSRRVVPGRLLEAGFRFEFPEWSAAAQDLVRRWRKL